MLGSSTHRLNKRKNCTRQHHFVCYTWRHEVISNAQASPTVSFDRACAACIDTYRNTILRQKVARKLRDTGLSDLRERIVHHTWYVGG